MRALGRKKNTCFFGNVQPKTNARAHLKQWKKNIVALSHKARQIAWLAGQTVINCTRKVMFLVLLVGMSVTLSVCLSDYLKSKERICMKFSPEVCFNVRDDLDYGPNKNDTTYSLFHQILGVAFFPICSVTL